MEAEIIKVKPIKGAKFRCNCCRRLILWANLHKHMLMHEKQGEVTIERRESPGGALYNYSFNIIRQKRS